MLEIIEPLAEKALSIVSSKFVTKFSSLVIEKWSKYRARQFFVSFVDGINKIKLLDDSDTMLLEILEDEYKSEILFDSYRRCVLSASKELGPRIIGFLTARLVAENRIANEIEETIAMAAETLNDIELKAFSEYFCEYLDKAKQGNDKNVILEDIDLKINLYEETVDSYFPADKINISINFGDILGIWALKLKNLGILREDIVEEHWEYNERHIDADGRVREIIWWLAVSIEYELLVELIKRAVKLDF